MDIVNHCAHLNAIHGGIKSLKSLCLPLAFCILLLAFLIPADLRGQSLLEKEDFSYIVKLYYASDAYLSEVKAEIASFRARYPESEYIQYLDYLDANVALKQGDFTAAREMYRILLTQDLHPDILADVYLNYAISCYNLGDYTQTMSLLADLEKVTANPYYIYQVRVWRGRIYTQEGFYLSAEQEYRLALEYDPQEVRYDYFLVLLQLDRFDEAKNILDGTAASEPKYFDYQSSWLNYLLGHGDYPNFDDQVAYLLRQPAPLTPNVSLLRIRKALETENYDIASALIDSLGTESPRREYYRAIVLAHTGSAVEADSLFQQLSRSQDPDIAVYAYLERLKLLYARDPATATKQLQDFLAASKLENAEAYYLLGDFLFRNKHYLEAVSQFVTALDFPMTPVMADRVEDHIAEAYYLAGEFDLSAAAYNRYLNHQPEGRFRDKAFYYLGLINYSRNEYREARLNLEKVVSDFPRSAWVDEARFYLAEMHYLNSEYAQAAELYKSIVLTDANYPEVLLRLAQIYYNQEKYAEAIQLLQNIPASDLDFDATVLMAGIRFNQKDYNQALRIYETAETLAKTEPQKTEAKAYRAYTLYYLKRYNDASLVFYDLSRDITNADIYLYQAAKSAAQGKQWTRALDLYDQFTDEFPESNYFLPVLAEIATIQFNLGKYSVALEEWENLLRRFTANEYISQEDQPLLGEVFTGIETCARQVKDPAAISDLAAMVDLFRSDYIKFELEYIIVKLYADAGLWEDLLAEASEVRGSLNLPANRRNAIELLMVQSLVNLNQWERADSLASEVYSSTGSRESLIKLADIAARTGNPELAMQRYLQAWDLQADPDLWLKMIELSADNQLHRFPELWAKGETYRKLYPQTRVLLIQYLFESGDLAGAAAEADSMLASEPNPWLRAQAEYYHGRIAYSNQDWQAALRSFRKIRLLYKEYGDVYTQASYYYILCLLRLEARQEAQLAFDEVRKDLSPQQVSEIAPLLETGTERKPDE